MRCDSAAAESVRKVRKPMEPRRFASRKARRKSNKGVEGGAVDVTAIRSRIRRDWHWPAIRSAITVLSRSATHVHSGSSGRPSKPTGTPPRAREAKGMVSVGRKLLYLIIQRIDLHSASAIHSHVRVERSREQVEHRLELIRAEGVVHGSLGDVVGAVVGGDQGDSGGVSEPTDRHSLVEHTGCASGAEYLRWAEAPVD